MPDYDVATVPTPGELLQKLDRIHDLALNHIRVYENKDGDIRECLQPDYRAAIAAVRCVAEICGYIRERPQFETPVLVRDALLRAMADPELGRMMLEQIAARARDDPETRRKLLEALEPGLLVESTEKGSKK